MKIKVNDIWFKNTNWKPRWSKTLYIYMYKIILKEKDKEQQQMVKYHWPIHQCIKNK